MGYDLYGRRWEGGWEGWEEGVRHQRGGERCRIRDGYRAGHLEGGRGRASHETDIGGVKATKDRRHPTGKELEEKREGWCRGIRMNGKGKGAEIGV